MTNPVGPEFLDRRLDARGVPKGGLTGQALTKVTDVDNEVTWSDLTVADGSITASKLAADAVTTPAILNDAVTPAKIAQGTAGQVLMTNGTPDTAWTTLTGDVTVNSTGVTAIGSGVIVDGDIAAGAAITLTKLANITAGRVLLGNASNIPTATALSGDVTVNSTGVTAIGNDTVTAAKIAQGTAGQVLMTNGTPDTAWTTLTGDVTVNSTGLTAIGAGVVVAADLATSTGELAGPWNSDTITTVTTPANFTNTTTGTVVRRWQIVGKRLYFRVWYSGGTATAAGAVTVRLPGSASIQAGRAQFYNGVNGTTLVTAYTEAANPTFLRITNSNAGGNFAAGASLTSVTVNGVAELA